MNIADVICITAITVIIVVTAREHVKAQREQREPRLRQFILLFIVMVLATIDIALGSFIKQVTGLTGAIVVLVVTNVFAVWLIGYTRRSITRQMMHNRIKRGMEV